VTPIEVNDLPTCVAKKKRMMMRVDMVEENTSALECLLRR